MFLEMFVLFTDWRRNSPIYWLVWSWCWWRTCTQ